MAWGGKGDFENGPWGPNRGNKGPQRPTPPKNSGGGGGRGNPPPPDFDEWFRKNQDRFKGMVPGGGSKRGWVLLLGTVLALWALSGFYLVKPDEQGVVMRFGKYHTTTGPGLNYHLPYPIENVITPSVTTVNREEIGFRSANNVRNRGQVNMTSVPEESLMLTGDENIVDVQFEVQWKIGDAAKFLFNIRNPEETVKAAAESAMREVIGQSSITPLKGGQEAGTGNVDISKNKSKLQFGNVLAEGKLEVEQAAKVMLQETLADYDSGIEVVALNLLAVEPPGPVIADFRDVQSARVDMETERNRAEAYRNEILPKARGQAEQMFQDATAYREEVMARARGEAARFLSIYNEYKQAKDVTRKRIYLETMENILQGMDKVIIDDKAGNVLPYLPLPEVKRKNQEAPAATSGGKP